MGIRVSSAWSANPAAKSLRVEGRTEISVGLGLLGVWGWSSVTESRFSAMAFAEHIEDFVGRVVSVCIYIYVYTECPIRETTHENHASDHNPYPFFGLLGRFSTALQGLKSLQDLCPKKVGAKVKDNYRGAP